MAKKASIKNKIKTTPRGSFNLFVSCSNGIMSVMNIELSASIFGIFSILNSASFWWLVILVLVALVFFRANKKK